MVDYFILPHLGLGDQFIMNGFVHFTREVLKANRILILAKEPHTPTLRDLYSEYSNISFITVKGDHEIWGLDPEPFRAMLKKITDDGYKSIPFGVFSGSNEYLKLDPCWANCFYLQHKIPICMRFNYFRIPKDLSKSEAIYKKAIQRFGKNYIVIHDDPSRNLAIDYANTMNWLTENSLSDYPCIYLGQDRYKYPLCPFLTNPNCKELFAVDSLIDYVCILQNAKALIMIDSSIAILADMVYDETKNPLQKRLSYIRYSAFPTKGLYKNEWDYSD